MAVMISSETLRRAKARIQRGKLAGVGGHRLFEGLCEIVENKLGLRWIHCH